MEMPKQGLNILELPVKCVQSGIDCSIPLDCWDAGLSRQRELIQ